MLHERPSGWTQGPLRPDLSGEVCGRVPVGRVSSRQRCDYCAAYGLASALHAYGDAAAAASVVRSARAALASGDAFGHVRKVVRSEAAGWSEVPLAHYDPLHTHIAEPVHMQLVGSDGAGTHAVATLGGLIFDAAEQRALPLSRASLDRCVGMHLNGATFSHVARAVKLVPGKSVRRMLARCARE